MSSSAGHPASSPLALPRGPHALTREQVAANQRLRVILAMIDVVGEKGYGASTVVEIASRAGISRNSFYAQFPDKQTCLLAAYDAIMEEVSRKLRTVYAGEGGWSGRVHDAIAVLFEAAAHNPGAARLALVEITAAGPAGIERREHAVGQYLSLIRDGLTHEPGGADVPDTVLRGVVGGLSRILHARVQEKQPTGLVALVPDLVTWALAYRPTPPALPRAPSARGAAQQEILCGGRAPGTLHPHATLDGTRWLARGARLSHSYVVHSQRERILDAVANLTAAEGYPALTVDAIAAEAGVSLQAFYEHFTGKQDAFTVTYQVGHAKALGIVQRAFQEQGDWRHGVRAAVRALLAFLASEPAFTRLAVLESLTAGSETAASIEHGIAAYAEMLLPGFDQAPSGAIPPPVTIEAITGALFELCFKHVTDGRTAQLGELETHATYIALAPFIGARQAARIATARRTRTL